MTVKVIAMERRSLLGVVLAVLLATSIPMPAYAFGARPAPVVLHLKFRLLARNVWGLNGSGRYVGYTNLFSHPEKFVLLDQQTGRRTILSRPACGSGMLGSSWVAFDCPQATERFQLYNIRTRKWRRLTCDATCQQFYYLIDIRAVGARWLELTVAPHQPCGDGEHNSCGPTTSLFYNIATGRRRSPSTRSTTTITDLDSSTLTRPICPPLQASTGSQSALPLALTFYGRFAVAQEQTGVYVERCGSKLHMPLATGRSAGTLFASNQAVVFCGFPSPAPYAILPPVPQNSGIFLPSLRRFTYNLQSGQSTCPGFAVLGAHHIYFADQQQRLWGSAFPSNPPGSR